MSKETEYRIFMVVFFLLYWCNELKGPKGCGWEMAELGGDVTGSGVAHGGCGTCGGISGTGQRML